MSSMNKTKAVPQWLQTGAGISSMEAIKQFGATRLSAIIFNLRKRGYDIEAVTCEGTDRFGNKVQFARYYLRDPTPESSDNLL